MNKIMKRRGPIRGPLRQVATLLTLVMLAAGLFPAALVQAAPVPTAPDTQLAQDVGTSSIQVDAFTCSADVMPEGGGRIFADFQAACTTASPGENFTLHQSDDTKTVQATNASGRTTFTYPVGSPVRFYSDVPLEADESLFCSVNQGAPESVTIDGNGVSTFTNNTAETRVCSWFLVEQPAAQSSITLTGFTCPDGDVQNPQSATYADFTAACTDPAPNVDFHLGSGELSQDQTTDAQGKARFTFETGAEASFYSKVPLEADESLFCTSDEKDPARVTIDAEGVSHFPNDTAADLTCLWFVVDAPQATATVEASPTEEATATVVPTDEPTETVAPTETTVPTEAATETAVPTETTVPTEAATETAVPTETTDLVAGRPGNLASIALTSHTCATDFDASTDARDFGTLSSACTDATTDVTFSFGYPNGDADARLTDGTYPLTFEQLDPGNYTLYSDVPLGSANEYLFCTADGGNQYEKTLSDRGVATFNDLATETITCDWFIVPTTQRQEQTGASIEIHLSACPADYTGSALFTDCHSNGIDGQDFVVSGPGGDHSVTTEVLQPDTTGVATVQELAAGTYEIKGGPPGDFGAVKFFCSTQPGNTEATYSFEDFTGTVTLAENQHVVCDWYFIPESQLGSTPTPTATATATPAPKKAEITVTLFACPATNAGYGGASLSTLNSSCTEKVNDVTFRIGDPNNAPIAAKTGISGDGAVRFYDLLPGDLQMSPLLPSNLTSTAVFCRISDGDPYQKALSNGGTTFVDLDGESISCSWYAVKAPVTTPQSPTGSITVREYLCEKGASEIKDWEAECTPGSSGSSFTLGVVANGTTQQGTPNEKGVYTFSGLKDGFYTLKQDTGGWCKAVADRVDSQSRVIVQGGGNTDVVLYQCNTVEKLPTTGSGDSGSIGGKSINGLRTGAIMLGCLALPMFALALASLRKRRQPVLVPIVERASTPVRDDSGRIRMRFR